MVFIYLFIIILKNEFGLGGTVVQCYREVLVFDVFVQGMRRVFLDVDDISVDVPTASALLEKIVNKLKASGTVSDELAAELPSRSDCKNHTIECA